MKEQQTKTMTCPICNGEMLYETEFAVPSDGGYEVQCHCCGGFGVITKTATKKTCPACNGKGEVRGDKCLKCNRKGVVYEY